MGRGKMDGDWFNEPMFDPATLRRAAWSRYARDMGLFQMMHEFAATIATLRAKRG